MNDRERLELIDAVLDDIDSQLCDSVLLIEGIKDKRALEPLIGEFDLIVRNDAEETVCDWKTSASKWQTGKADWDLQATTFCYAYQQLYGRIPLFRFDVFTKAKQPTASSYYTVRTEDDLRKFIFLAQQIEKSIQSGLFYPNENCMNCSECPYKKQCKSVCQKGCCNE